VRTEGKWSPDAKALFIRGGRLVYDIGWLGAINWGPKVNDGKPHTAVLSVSGGTAKLWLDGKEIAEKANFTKPDQKGMFSKWDVPRRTSLATSPMAKSVW
jgi:hypothetical protein